MAYRDTPTCWLEPTDRVAIGLRRYASIRSDTDHPGFTCEAGYHAALVFIGESEAAFEERDGYRVLGVGPATDHEDPRWPTACTCGYQFTAEDHWQDWQELIYQRTDTGQRVTLRERQPSDVGGLPAAPAGATWDGWWMPPSEAASDRIHLMVRLPNGRDWHVDSRASNCARPDQPHACWVRHGDPRQCQVTVDKNGDTCAAGAGSIQAGDYHGFLRNGVLTES